MIASTKFRAVDLAFAGLWIYFATLALAQDHPQVASIDKGFVDGNSYKNISLGLQLTPPASLVLGTPQLSGRPNSLPSMVEIGATGKNTWSTSREAMFFYADTLAYYPDDQRSTEAYTQKVVRANQNNGFVLVGGSPVNELGGVSFARVDFSKKGPAYEVVLVRTCERQALVFVFTGSVREVADKLIAGTRLKLDASVSGCNSKGTQHLR